jgi:hypothetical protein
MALLGIRLLLVEDNDINLQIASEILTDAGAVIEVARNGRVAVEVLQDNPERFHAVLMDVQMPEMDGIEATRHIRHKLTAERLPIIAMTAHAMAEERQRCLDAGMNDHIAKPIDPAGLVGIVRRWTASRAAVQTPAPDTAPPVRPPAQTLSPLPDRLPPFDIPDALRRLGGKRDLLHRLLLRFHTEFASAGHVLRQHLATGEAEEAERLAHKLVGTSSSLGAHGLADAARALEQAIRLGETAQIPGLTANFESALIAAIAAAGSLASTQPAVVRQQG